MSSEPATPRERAKEIVNKWLEEDWKYSLLINAIAAALTVPEGHVRLPSGEDVKVLGELVMTIDGCVVGKNAKAWEDADADKDGGRGG